MGAFMATIVGALITGLATAIGNFFADAAGTFVMFTVLWKLIGKMTLMFFSGAMGIVGIIFDETFFTEFSFFPRTVYLVNLDQYNFLSQIIPDAFLTTTTGNPTNVIATKIIESISSLEAVLSMIAWAIFAWSIVIMVYKMMFSPVTGDKPIGPFQIIFRIVVFTVLLITWKQFMSLYFAFFEQTVGTLGRIVTRSLVSGIDNFDASQVSIETGWFSFLNLINTNSEKAGESALYLVHCLSLFTVALSIFQACISYIERYLTLMIYCYIAPPFIAIGSYNEASGTLTEYIKGILSQSIGIVLSMWALMLGFNVCFSTMKPGVDLESGVVVLYLMLSVAFFNVSKNSEKYLNMVGFRTMPSGDTARSLLAGAGSLAMASRFIGMPIANAAGKTVSGTLRGVNGKAIDAGLSSYKNKNFGSSGLGKVDNEAFEKMKEAGKVGEDISKEQKRLSDIDDKINNLDKAEAKDIKNIDGNVNDKIYGENGYAQQRDDAIDKINQSYDDSISNQEAALNDAKTQALFEAGQRAKLDEINSNSALSEAEKASQIADIDRQVAQDMNDRLEPYMQESREAHVDDYKAIENNAGLSESEKQEQKSALDKQVSGEAVGKMYKADSKQYEGDSKFKQDSGNIHDKEVALNNTKDAKQEAIGKAHSDFRRNESNAKEEGQKQKQAISNDYANKEGGRNDLYAQKRASMERLDNYKKQLAEMSPVKSNELLPNSDKVGAYIGNTQNKLNATDKDAKVAWDDRGNSYAMIETQSKNSSTGRTEKQMVAIPLSDGAPSLEPGTHLYNEDGVIGKAGGSYATIGGGAEASIITPSNGTEMSWSDYVGLHGEQDVNPGPSIQKDYEFGYGPPASESNASGGNESTSYFSDEDDYMNDPDYDPVTDPNSPYYQESPSEYDFDGYEDE